MSANHILQNYLSAENIPELEMGWCSQTESTLLIYKCGEILISQLYYPACRDESHMRCITSVLSTLCVDLGVILANKRWTDYCMYTQGEHSI